MLKNKGQTVYYHVITHSKDREYHTIVYFKLYDGIDPYFRANEIHKKHYGMSKDFQGETCPTEITEGEAQLLTMDKKIPLIDGKY